MNNHHTGTQYTLKSSLTARESEVAHLILRGYTNLHISLTLSIEEVTVEAHITKIYKKYAVKNRAAFILKVVNDR